jgi:hypothetical protein
MSDNIHATARTMGEGATLPALGDFLRLSARSAGRLLFVYLAVAIPVLLADMALRSWENVAAAQALRSLGVILAAPFVLGTGVLQMLAIAEGRAEPLLESARASARRLWQTLGLLAIVAIGWVVCFLPVVLGEAALGGEHPASLGISSVLLLASILMATSALVCAGPVIGAFFKKGLRPIDAAFYGVEISRGRRLQVGVIVLAALALFACISLALGAVAWLVPRAEGYVVVLRGAFAYVLACALCVSGYRFLRPFEAALPRTRAREG